MNFIQDMLIEKLENIDNEILSSSKPFINFILNNDKYMGWKFTIIGKTVEDSIDLVERLGQFLININVNFKVGTLNLIERNHPEQSKKLMTIYITENVNSDYLIEDIKYFLKGYDGHIGITLEKSELVFGPIFKRYDLNNNGNYIPANN